MEAETQTKILAAVESLKAHLVGRNLPGGVGASRDGKTLLVGTANRASARFTRARLPRTWEGFPVFVASAGPMLAKRDKL
jgi:hypothetical protein